MLNSKANVFIGSDAKIKQASLQKALLKMKPMKKA
jgi:hypothetical protein